MTQDRRRTRKYLTLAARNASLCKAFATALSCHTACFSDLQLDGLGTSIRSQIHGSNRNRIALHVMLSGRRNFTRSL